MRGLYLSEPSFSSVSLMSSRKEPLTAVGAQWKDIDGDLDHRLSQGLRRLTVAAAVNKLLQIGIYVQQARVENNQMGWEALLRCSASWACVDL